MVQKNANGRNFPNLINSINLIVFIIADQHPVISVLGLTAYFFHACFSLPRNTEPAAANLCTIYLWGHHKTNVMACHLLSPWWGLQGYG